ncbi:putative DNA binding domain-containing protein [bacterium]|nr:putative DNA binding domain-containing protein [bacterium]
MDIEEIIMIPENRRLEFKETLPESNQIAKSAIAFANSGGGKIIIGVCDNPREAVGIDEDKLFEIEEAIGNIIYDSCYPIILPEITFVRHNDKNLLVVQIYPGNNKPYYLKSAGKRKGTYIRVGSSNKIADDEIIEELERRKRRISYDSVVLYDYSEDVIDFGYLRTLFEKNSERDFTKEAMINLGLVAKERESLYSTVAGVLLASFDVKRREFPYAKIECARFKGITPEIFIDQQTIDEPLVEMIEKTMAFIKRNIAKSSKIGEIYREDRWEYPLEAIRELAINAIVHRDYSLLGKDIKIAIYDDMFEITSPGMLPDSITIQNLGTGQSEIRNRVIAPIFKEFKLIEQWGTGFKKIHNLLNDYPELELRLAEPGLSFQVQLVKKDYHLESGGKFDVKAETDEKFKTNFHQVDTDESPSCHQAVTKLTLSKDEIIEILSLLLTPKRIVEIMEKLDYSDRTYFRQNYLDKLMKEKLVELTIPDKPTSPKQKYVMTGKGKQLLEFVFTDEFSESRKPEPLG